MRVPPHGHGERVSWKPKHNTVFSFLNSTNHGHNINQRSTTRKAPFSTTLSLKWFGVRALRRSSSSGLQQKIGTSSYEILQPFTQPYTRTPQKWSVTEVKLRFLPIIRVDQEKERTVQCWPKVKVSVELLDQRHLSADWLADEIHKWQNCKNSFGCSGLVFFVLIPLALWRWLVTESACGLGSGKPQLFRSREW